MRAWPILMPVTIPYSFTSATEGSLEVQVIGVSSEVVGISSSFSPIPTDLYSVPKSTVIFSV